MSIDFFNLAPVVCFVLTPEGVIRDVNPPGATLLAQPASALVGQPLAAFVLSDDRGALKAFLHNVNTSAAAQRAELKLNVSAGTGATSCARIEAYARRDAEGRVLDLPTVLIDVTEACATRDALIASEARLRRAVIEAPLPVAIYTEDGEILALSRLWTESTGYRPEELPTLSAWILRVYGSRYIERKLREISKNIQYLFTHNTPLHIGERELRTRHRGRRVWDFYAAPLGELPDGRRAVISMAIDVTERKETEAELIRARDRAEEMARMKSTFLANMSHEIRTPLTGIIGFAAVLSRELPDEYREFAELIEGSGRRLLDMLNSVLDLAKLEADQLQLQLERVDIAEESTHSVRLLQPLARESGLELSVEVGDAPIEAELDRPAFNRILHNLIGNAIKFTDAGTVLVRAEAAGSSVHLSVTDTGIGIDAAFLPHLFEEFSQESTGTNRTHNGSGLGLAITKRLVELMGGRITVQSRKGQGTTFTVSFPRVQSAPAAAVTAPAADAQQPETNRRRIRLLLVEDQMDAQYLLLELLDDLYEVTVASTADEALHLARSTSFDLILLDIQLGAGPDGTSVLHRLRDLPAYQDTPILALTAYALPGDRERFLEMGFTAYLSKPFDVDELLRLSAQLLAT